ncbi:serine hydrolase domain-containing protein [Paucibacter sp. AS339]|uniref:serine hydrolase domain-containing protein n=1 Tax=Paucibacter hankyongi TaxID=3133434 RepID=UPI00309594AC
MAALPISVRSINSADQRERRRVLAWLSASLLSQLAAAAGLATVATANAAESGDLPDLIGRLTESVPSLLRDLHVPGAALALLQHGQVVWHGQFGLREAGGDQAIGPDTVFEAASMSKPLFAYLVLQQVQAGRLELDRPVLQYLPQERFKPRQSWQGLITARMLLTHRSGLPNWRSAADEKTHSLRIGSKPGQAFNYSGEGYFYLQRVLEHITGQALQDLAERMLFSPLGMRHSAFQWTPDLDELRARGHNDRVQVLPRQDYRAANAAYTLYTTAADYALFLAEILNPDRSGAQSLQAPALRAMLAHATPATDREPLDRPGLAKGLAVFWGLGWAINTSAQGDIAYHTGTNSTGFRNYCQFSPSRGSGFVLMSNGLNGKQLWMRLMALLGDR